MNLPTLIIYNGRFITALLSKFALVSFDKEHKVGTAYCCIEDKTLIQKDFLENTKHNLSDIKLRWVFYDDISDLQRFALDNKDTYYDQDILLWEKSLDMENETRRFQN